MKDGAEQPVLLSALNLELHGQLCCLTISREISDLKMTQRELVAAREAALAASRAKSEFLSSMSHEIRTPMNSILGMADQLMETALDDEQRRYLSTVISNGHALLALINGILDLAKVESGRISLEAIEFDLKDAIEKVLETLAIRAHEKGLELMVRFAPEIPDLVLGDSLRLGQILINLVGNAIKFTHKGQVMVTVEHDPGSTAAGALKFTVRDTGIGIAADQRHLLFHPFSQADSSTSRKYGGSGLGLAIVARLVALMHGTVEVSSEAGSGSAFSFTARFGTAPAIAASAAALRRHANYRGRRQRRQPLDSVGSAHRTRGAGRRGGVRGGSDGEIAARQFPRLSGSNRIARQRAPEARRIRVGPATRPRGTGPAAARDDARHQRLDLRGRRSARDGNRQLPRQTGAAR